MIDLIRRFLQREPSSGYQRKPSLVLVNGLAEQSESWFCNREVWQQHFDVHMPGLLVYDGPILQERVRSGAPIDVDFLTHRLAAYLDGFVQSPPYYLVASSLGAQVVVEYAARHPAHVSGMVLLCPSGMGGEENLPIVEGVRHHDYQGLVRSVFHNAGLAHPAIADYYRRRFASRTWRKAALHTVRCTKGHSVRDRLPLVTCPTMVICGREDRIVDTGGVREAVSGLSNFSLIEIPECGHAPQLECPAVVNPLVAEFLLGSGEAPRTHAPRRPELVGVEG